MENSYDNIAIKKAKIKNDLFLEVEYSESTPDGTNTVKKDCTAPVHDDLKAQFALLDDHLAQITEQYTGKKNEYAEVACKGFTLGGNGESSGFVLIGSRDLEEGRQLNLTSPFVKFEDYHFIDDIIKDCKQEILEYLFEGKHKPDAQQVIPFAELEEAEK